MNKRLLSILLALLMMVSFAGCHQQRNADPVQSMTSLCDEVEANANSYSESDWERVLEQYEAIEERIEHSEMTQDQSREYGRQVGRFCSIITKYALGQAEEYLDALGDYMEGFEEGFDIDDVLDDIDF